MKYLPILTALLPEPLTAAHAADAAKCSATDKPRFSVIINDEQLLAIGCLTIKPIC